MLFPYSKHEVSDRDGGYHRPAAAPRLLDTHPDSLEPAFTPKTQTWPGPHQLTSVLRCCALPQQALLQDKRQLSCPGTDGVWELICPQWLSGTGSIAYITAKPCSLQAMAAAVWSEMRPKPLLPKSETISCSLVSHQPGPQLDHPSWLLPCLNTSNKVAACQELFSGTQVSTWAQG